MHGPRLLRPPSSLAPTAGRLELAGVERSLAARGWSPRAAPTETAPTTAVVGAGECVSLVGDRRAAVALLWCIAGLTRPSRGELRWLDGTGEPTAPPRRAFVGAGWRGYDCWTVRDALESAVPAGAAQREADRRIRAVERRELPGASAHVPLAALAPSRRWLVGVAAAVVAGARWLLLEAPPVTPADVVAVHHALRALLAACRTVIGVAADGASGVLPESRLLPLAPLVARPHDGGPARRVAELAGGAGRAPGEAAGVAPHSVDLPPGAP